MSLFDKIKTIYPSLKDVDFEPIFGSIVLQNDGDGDYIAQWNHPTLEKPTDTQLANT
jgi:hypothetical protein